MMKNKMIIFLSALNLFSCSHGVKTMNTQELATAGSDKSIEIKSGFVLPFLIRDKKENLFSGHCVFSLRRENEANTFDFEVPQGKETILGSLEPGKYRFYRLTCDRKSIDITDMTGGLFEVKANQIITLPSYQLVLLDSNHYRWHVLNRKETTRDYQKIWSITPDSLKSHFYSPYRENTRITKKMIDETPEKLLFKSKGELEKTIKKSFIENMKTCYKAEFVRNPLWLGTIQIEISKDKIETKNSLPNTFMPFFEKCAFSEAALLQKQINKDAKVQISF